MESAAGRQNRTRPKQIQDPPAPKNILRGHKSQVHAAIFLRGNERLATGDADGFVVLWDLTIMRPRAVWRAHDSAILSVRGWGDDKIITHGRDHKLIVWKVEFKDEERLSTVLPLEEVPTPRPQPWVLHILEVNTMNFCSFGLCPSSPSRDSSSRQIDIYELPSQARKYTVKPGQGHGMAMALALVQLEGALTLIAAFENGSASVHRLVADDKWVMTYRSQCHDQPVLSLDVHPSLECFITSSADAIIAKHPIPTEQQEVAPILDPNNRIIKEIDASTEEENVPLPKASEKPWEHPLATGNTKHAGQQSLQIRSDGRIFATAGWDSKIRVYSNKMKELAVLEWHKVGCYAVAFAIVSSSTSEKNTPGNESSKATDHSSAMTSLTGRATQLSIKQRRIKQAEEAHWIAAGAKDGKVSLWEVY